MSDVAYVWTRLEEREWYYLEMRENKVSPWPWKRFITRYFSQLVVRVVYLNQSSLPCKSGFPPSGAKRKQGPLT